MLPMTLLGDRKVMLENIEAALVNYSVDNWTVLKAVVKV